MGTTMSVLLAGQGYGAQDGYEDKNRRHLEGEEQIAEEHFAEVGGGDHVVAQPRLCQVSAGGKKDEGQDADQDGDSRNADEVGGAAALGKLFFAGIEQHDDEGEEDHDGAGINDDLSGGQKLRAQQQVEHG